MEFNKFLLGLIICFLLSFCLGLERQIRRRFIGLRTMILVSLGAYFFVSFSFLITGYQSDVTRIASQVVAGIGFLGAGVIIKDSDKGKIRGLTTAATLWCDAGIGMLCAAGLIKEAIVAAIAVLFSNIVLRQVNSIVNSKIEEKNINELFLVIFITNKNQSQIIDSVTRYDVKNEYIEVKNCEVSDDKVEFKIMIRKNEDNKLSKFIDKIVVDNKINNYKYDKLSEIKIEESDDEL